MISDDTPFAPALNVDLATMTRTDSGVAYRDLEIGTGETAVAGKTLDMHYTGWLSNGTQFDSSIGRGPFTFRLGADRVIDGWHNGIPGMKVGGSRLIVIPPDQGYGPVTYGPIPGNSILVFKVELVALG